MNDRSVQGNRRGAEAAEDAEGSLLPQLTDAVIGAAIEVHRELGLGYIESVYENALCLELTTRGIPYQRQPTQTLLYRGTPIGEMRLDLLIDDVLIVEIKAIEALGDVHTSQLLSYLKATGLPLGLLINFNVPVLRRGIRRLANTRPSSATSAASAPLRLP
ncbi:MAG: GxxExxY protein [Planctomycetota bacterium]